MSTVEDTTTNNLPEPVSGTKLRSYQLFNSEVAMINEALLLYKQKTNDDYSRPINEINEIDNLIEYINLEQPPAVVALDIVGSDLRGVRIPDPHRTSVICVHRNDEDDQSPDITLFPVLEIGSDDVVDDAIWAFAVGPDDDPEPSA